jgi:hypothetical protein
LETPTKPHRHGKDRIFRRARVQKHTEAERSDRSRAHVLSSLWTGFADSKSHEARVNLPRGPGGPSDPTYPTKGLVRRQDKRPDNELRHALQRHRPSPHFLSNMQSLASFVLLAVLASPALAAPTVSLLIDNGM